VFVLRQLRLQRRDAALLDLRTVASRTFTFAISMMAISMLVLFGVIILLPIYMQNVLGLDVLTTGMILLPGGLTMGLLAPTVGRIYDRIGPTALLTTGTVIVSAVLWFMTQFTRTTPVGWVLAAHITLSLGLALLFTPLFSAGLGSLKPELYSHGSAIVGTVQQLAGAAGTALFITVMSAQAATLAIGGESEVSSLASGIRLAFLVGAIISVLAIPAAFLVRTPQQKPAPALT
jgi:DHA2 family lincomycin resistance protein-like MFS transporter